MPLNKYRVLSKIAETGKMNKAAQELVYSKPNMSRIIKLMEEEYGFSLLVRTRDGVQLTENAKKILPMVNRIIEDENELLEIVNQIRETEDGIRNVKIGAVGSAVIGIVQDSIKIMEKEHEGISVDVRYFVDGKFFYEGLSNGEVDFCIIVDGYQGDFDFEPVVRENFYAVFPRNQELANRTEISFRDLKDYSFIMTPDCPFLNEMQNICQKKCLFVDDKIFGIPIIERNEAIGIFSAPSKSVFEPYLSAVKLREKEYITIGIASCKDRELSPAAMEFKNILIRVAKELYK